MIKQFKIGDFIFEITYPDKMLLPEHFMIFETENQPAAYHYEIILSDRFPQPDGVMTARRPDLLVYCSGDREIRYLGVKGVRGYYACCKEINENCSQIYLSTQYGVGLHVDPMFVSLFALERRMFSYDSMILHCAYLRHGKEAILFSAPSGTGKTTQATLWEKYRQSETINGDRALLRKIDGQWYACGWPVCGTSGICQNKEMPIRAIVMLSQGKENHVERLSVVRAFSLVYPQITINGWNERDCKKIMGLIEELITDVPVYHLSCTISEEAVKCLEQSL